jgi:hypothetical protein
MLKKIVWGSPAYQFTENDFKNKLRSMMVHTEFWLSSLTGKDLLVD